MAAKQRKKITVDDDNQQVITEVPAKPTEKAKKEAKKEAKKAPEKKEPETHVEVIKDRKQEAKMRLRAVRDIRERDTELWVELAEQLHEIQDKKLYHHMINPVNGEQYKSFQEFAQSETSYSERKANYLLAIWRYYVVDHSREFLDEVKGFGWVKCKEMIDYICEDNRKEVVSMIDGTDGGSGMSVKDLKAHVKEVRTKKKSEKKKAESKSDPADSHTGKDSSKSDRPSKKNFSLFPQQMENVDTALAQAKKVRNTESDAEALDIMALDFLSNHLAPSKESAKILLANAESALGGRVIFLKGGDVVYGMEGSSKKERILTLLGMLEDELQCELLAVKDKEIFHLGFEGEYEDPVRASLAMMESTLGVQLFAVKNDEIVFIHPELEPYVLSGEEE